VFQFHGHLLLCSEVILSDRIDASEKLGMGQGNKAFWRHYIYIKDITGIIGSGKENWVKKNKPDLRKVNENVLYVTGR